MKCTHCGAETELGSLYCVKCGSEMRIVPDYNPLDDVLTAQVRGGIDDATGRLDTNRLNTGRQTAGRRTGIIRQSEYDGRTKPISQIEIDARKKQIIRKKERLRRKKQKRMFVIFIILALVALVVFGLYQNSYTGRVRSAYGALNQKSYNKAAAKFEKAISKKIEKPDAYVGLAKVYLARDEESAAETLFLSAIEAQPNNADLFKATLDFYLDIDQEVQISPLIDECNDESVLKAVSDYVSKQPKYSLLEREYDDVQELKLTSKGNTIYYTTDGSEATAFSTEYTGPIQIEEGTIVIKAIAVNKKGISSLSSEETYTVELPIEDAPSVVPSTGQYEHAVQITVNVPDGYVAYYTTDDTTPTTSSTKYTGPIDMPEGNTIFCAILVNGKGKVSDVTKRNYDLLAGE